MTHPTDTAPGRCPVAYPFAGEHRLDLEDDYARARASGHLLRVTLPVGGDAWLATTYDQVRTVLTHPRMERGPANQPSTPRLETALMTEQSVLALDGPTHARLRRAIAGAFSPRTARRIRPCLKAESDRLLDRFLAGEQPADLVAAYTDPLASTAVRQLIGQPPNGGEDTDVVALVNALAQARETPAEAEARDQLENAVDRITRSRDLPPGLLRDLSLTRAIGTGLTTNQSTDLVFAVVLGGRTPSFFLPSAALALLQHPAHITMLRRHPHLWPKAVEELLRFIPIGLSGGFPRTATAPVDVAGHQVEVGETVLPAMIAANLDDHEFPHASALDFTRSRNTHLAFGAGPHRCPGAPLSRHLIEVSLRSLIDRAPALRLATLAPATWHTGRIVRALATLPVEW
ncbi:cytochrome P450 [Streptomyces sp. NPDC021096]|uniref:cytochrome P450 n=1 Tax=Streptomyces sp. NPDC021096 TaxID=3154792 RepID=UPI0033C8F7ED